MNEMIHSHWKDHKTHRATKLRPQEGIAEKNRKPENKTTIPQQSLKEFLNNDVITSITITYKYTTICTFVRNMGRRR